jgi:thiol-disulfide isomerase/thioredoxin
MTSRTATEARISAKLKHRTRSPRWVWAAAAAVVVAAAAIAIAVSANDSGPKTADGLEQTRPVTVDGPALPPPDDSNKDPALGSTIPTVTGSSFDGAAVSITNDGKPKLLLFAAHWCPHCQREIPMLSDYLRTHPLPAGVELVTIATGTSADRPNYPPSTWLASNPLPGRILADSADSNAAAAFGLPGYPYFVAVDANGRVAARTSGEISTSQFDELVQRAIGSR